MKLATSAQLTDRENRLVQTFRAMTECEKQIAERYIENFEASGRTDREKSAEKPTLKLAFSAPNTTEDK